MTDRNILVIGGGTAGWLSALFLKKKNPQCEVSLIESSSIGILGAGEGGTPNLRSIIVDVFGFDEDDFLNKVNGTRKYGIIFEGWNYNTEHSFVHGFDYNGLENETYSYHFNARLFAEYLQNKSKECGVNHIYGEISEFVFNGPKISGVVLESGEILSADFFIDCSGFSRLIIGNIYKEKWNSYEDELLVNSAIPFFINEKNERINQKTLSKAAEFGWIWKIPLLDRWGCGYLYNDKFIDDDHIQKEIIRSHEGKDLSINKKIKFKAGAYENVWIENCVAIGLSSGFLEPLEATSIMTVVFQLKQLPENLFEDTHKDEYNYKVKQFNLQNMIFIRGHYDCSRNDTRFWKEYRGKKIPIVLKKVYDSFLTKESVNKIFGDVENTPFTKEQYIHIHTNNFYKNRKTII